MPGIRQDHKTKPGVIIKPNHYHYAIVPKRIWYSSKDGTVRRHKDWYIKEKDA